MMRADIRGLALAAFGGVISSWLWISVWGLSVAHVWFPLFREHWRILGGGDPHLAMFYAGTFDVMVSAILALLICTPLSYSLRGRRHLAWVVFIAALSACVIVPSVMDGETFGAPFLALFFSQAMTWAFVAASALAFWLGGVLRGKHVQA